MRDFDFSNLSDDELEAKISKRNMWIEAAYLEAMERAERAGQQEYALRFRQLNLKHRALHIDASIMANEIKNTPLPRGGER